jgi:hypothetical protein
VWQESSTEVHHAQKSTELNGGLGRVAVLEMDHAFIQRLGTFSGHLATEESNFGCLKDTLRQVDEDHVPLKLIKEDLQMLLVLLE